LQRIEQWSQPGRIIDDNEQQHICIITLDYKYEGGRGDTLQQPLLDGGQGKNNKSNEQQKSTLTGDMDGNEAPPPTATMYPQTSKAPYQLPAQSRPTHSSIGGPIITSIEDISSPPPKRAVMMVNGNTSLEGLQPPTLKAMGQLVSGADTDCLHLQNKRQQQQQALQVQQIQTPMWTTHTGSTKLPTCTSLPPSRRGEL
jgi:hypothetical protein